MKVSLNWLSEYVDWKSKFESPSDLADALTKSGLEVDEVLDRSKDYDNVVLGHILEYGKHPDADRLTLCQVTTGSGVVHQIVCGATNHKEGDHVVVALPGAVLPGNFKIKKSKIRGVESSGMLCSEKELGVSEESEGILILPESVTVGQSFSEYAGLDDVILDVNVTSNRADCLSHYGLAREIAAISGLEYSLPIKTFSTSASSTKKEVGLFVKSAEQCPRFAGRYISNVKIGPSPTWLKKYLEAVEINSINNVVDITNFVMLELGQPLHAYDVRELSGRKVIVDLAEGGEVFTTLDGTELKLDGSELMIRDADKPIGLAGIVGGKNSGIKDDTTDVFLESAYFKPEQVRRTSRKFGIETDACYRFSRGTDPDGVLLALNRASELIAEFAGGELYDDHYDIYPNHIRKSAVTVDVKDVTERLGFEATNDKFESWMKGIGCEVEVSVSQAGSFLITPPTFRQDLSIKEDFIEEYARLEGYDKIPDSEPFIAHKAVPHDVNYILKRQTQNSMRALGYSQAINFAFLDEKTQAQILGDVELLNKVGLKTSAEPVKIINPLSEELGVMRTSLVPGLLKNVSHNSRHGLSFGKLFEIGPTFSKDSEGYKEEWRLGLSAWGKQSNIWSKSDGPLVLEVKSHLENLLTNFNYTSFMWKGNVLFPEFLHPGQSAALFLEGKNIGYIGTLHPKLNEDLKIRETAVLAELNLDLFFKGQPRLRRTKTFSKFPFVDRDLALVVDKEISSGEIESAISKAGGSLLQEIHVFDVFEGGNIEPGMRSIAFRLVYQDTDGTLTDEVVNALQEKIIAAVAKKFGAQVR